MKRCKRSINLFATTYILFLLMLTIIQIPSVSATAGELFMGTSFGTLTVDGVSISLNHAYAMKQPNPFNATKKDVVILLTDKPLPESLLTDMEDITLAVLNLNPRNWVCFRIDETGELYNAMFDHPAIKGGRLATSVSLGIEYLPGVSKNDRIEGLFKSKKEYDMRGQKYQINTKFSAQIMPSSAPQLAKTKIAGIMDDLGMNKIEASNKPRSDWIEAEKALYRNVLKSRTFDILIVPFQVQAYAIDRPGRSLMTRYLASRIEDVTDTRVPNPTMIAGALGKDARSFDESEVYELANLIKAKTIIKGYVGHNRDEKMKLTIVIHSRAEHGSFEPGINTTRLEWQDIQFSDEHLPSEVFLSMLDEIISKLPLELKRKSEAIVYNKSLELLIPQKIQSIFQNRTNSPIVSAYYLQLLGMLFPEQTTAEENLFERSLVALSHVSTKSPDYSLLKARAYFYLHRRPASLAALGKPSNPAEEAFLALLNGNLPELKKWTDKIKSPLHKLMSQIELNDLRWSYTHLIGEEAKSITEKLPDWWVIISHRLNNSDEWYVQSNLEVKQKLDEAFPISNFTAKDLAMSRMAKGEYPQGGQDIDLSVYTHYHKILKNEGHKYCELSGSWYPIELDYLDLLNAIGESNLLKNVCLRLGTQALPEVALQILDTYEPIYRGHPEMTYLRAEALWKIAQVKQRDVRESIIKESKVQFYDVYYWSQGQTIISNRSFGGFAAGTTSPFPNTFFLYDSDYPKRPYWSDIGEGDRAVLKNSHLPDIFMNMSDKDKKSFKGGLLSLMYTHDDFNTLVMLYNGLMNLNEIYQDVEWKTDWSKLANTFLEFNKHRFIGHPSRMAFLAEHKSNKEDINIKQTYEDAIAANPDAWEPYMNLGSTYIKEGDFRTALTTFQRHPLISGQKKTSAVEMSNYAYQAGLELFWNGAVDEAQPLLKLAANSDTGSAAEMASSALLAILGRDYVSAAHHNLQLIKRYDNKYAYRDYLAFLHLIGFHKEAWALFNSIAIQPNSPQIWTAALIGLRMEQWTDDRLLRFLSQDNVFDADNPGKESFLLMAHLIDRDSVGSFTKIINDMKWKVDPKWQAVLQTTKNQLIDFANGYIAVKKDEFNKAYEIFTRQDYFKNNWYLNECLLPYIVWAGAKSGRLTEFDKRLEFNRENNDGFDVYLSYALLLGHKGNHRDAIKHLQLSSYRIPSTNLRPFFGWYQLVEVCEMLYKDTGYKGYRDLALRWAKLHQRILPMYAWAYAVEAKYTESSSDRLRALALTLYLDKQSEHISNFSNPEKAKAIEWMEKNNPFISKQDKSMVEM